MLYMNYSKILPALVPAHAKFGAMKKLVFDQSVFAGSMTVGFFMIMNTIEGNGLQKGMDDVRQKWLQTMLVNWQLWIPAQFINFYFTPIKFQVLFANFVSVFYNIALSFIYNSDAKKEVAAPEISEIEEVLKEDVKK